MWLRSQTSAVHTCAHSTYYVIDNAIQYRFGINILDVRRRDPLLPTIGSLKYLMIL